MKESATVAAQHRTAHHHHEGTHRMSDITIPTRAEFIRDRLAEHLDGLGYFGFDTEPETLDESPTLYFEWPTGDRCVFVDEMGAIRDMNEPERADGRTLTMRGFEWSPEPTDTGAVHGPRTAKVASLQDAAERFERADAGVMHRPLLSDSPKFRAWLAARDAYAFARREGRYSDADVLARQCLRLARRDITRAQLAEMAPGAFLYGQDVGADLVDVFPPDRFGVGTPCGTHDGRDGGTTVAVEYTSRDGADLLGSWGQAMACSGFPVFVIHPATLVGQRVSGTTRTV